MGEYKCDFVGTDDKLGCQLAAEHMQRRKPKRVLIFSACDTVGASRDRVAGFREAFQGKRCQLVEHAFGAFSCSDEDMEAVLRKELPADGILCVGDLLAIRCLRVLQRMEVTVPGDTGIVGFGDLGLPSDYGERLTTFDQNPMEVGRQAAKLLASRIESQGQSTRVKSILVPPTLVDMGTC